MPMTTLQRSSSESWKGSADGSKSTIDTIKQLKQQKRKVLARIMLGMVAFTFICTLALFVEDKQLNTVSQDQAPTTIESKSIVETRTK